MAEKYLSSDNIELNRNVREFLKAYYWLRWKNNKFS